MWQFLFVSTATDVDKAVDDKSCSTMVMTNWFWAQQRKSNYQCIFLIAVAAVAVAGVVVAVVDVDVDVAVVVAVAVAVDVVVVVVVAVVVVADCFLFFSVVFDSFWPLFLVLLLFV